MFPIATPPNAIVFATGRLSFTEMCLPGFCMNVIAIYGGKTLKYFIAEAQCEWDDVGNERRAYV